MAVARLGTARRSTPGIVDGSQRRLDSVRKTLFGETHDGPVRLGEHRPADAVVALRASAALRLTVTASRPAAAKRRRHVHARVQQLAVSIRVEPAADAAQAQPLRDGEHDLEPHGRLAEAAEHDLFGRSVEERDLDRPRDLVELGLVVQTEVLAVHAVGPFTEAERARAGAAVGDVEVDGPAGRGKQRSRRVRAAGSWNGRRKGHGKRPPDPRQDGHRSAGRV